MSTNVFRQTFVRLGNALHAIARWLSHRVSPNTLPAYLTNFLLRAPMIGAPRCFLPTGCSTYRKHALRTPRFENPTVHDTSPPSRRNPVRYAS